jgi:dTDP-4-amino-4,6-dideoxygalactose transaminase
VSDWGLVWRAIPDWPRRRFNTFTGTNLRSEWLAACRALASGDYTDAGPIRAYEEAFARQTGCSEAFSFGAGRMALYALLEALELNPGDEVILPGFTCVVVPNAMIYRGIRPVYVDIDPVTFNLDPSLIERAITPRTRAIHVQHTFGVSCDVSRIKEVADRHGLLLIEDAAHSLGARHQDRAHGSWGQVALFSTDRTKVINTHLGGMVTTNDHGIAKRLRRFQAATPFVAPSIVRRILFSFLAESLFYSPDLLWLGRPVVSALRRLGVLFYWSDELMERLPEGYPYPSRLSSGQARLGASQLSDLPRNLAHRRRLAEWLEARIGWYRGALPGPLASQAWLRYSFLVQDRGEFDRRLRARFDVPFWFTSVVYGRDRDLHLVGYEPGSCPVAERAARHVVNLPTHLRIPLSSLESLWSKEGAWIESQVRRPHEIGG